MKIILPQVIITDPKSPHNGQKMDIRINNGEIKEISRSINNIKDYDLIEFSRGRWVSPGWVDIRCRSGEPGNEQRETYYSLSKAAANGGYTHIGIQPSTNPVRDSKIHIESILQSTKNLDVSFLPLGALSKELKGEKLCEIYDMNISGAVGFSDDQNDIENPHLLQLALEYSKDLNTVIHTFCYEKRLSPNGQINEGEISLLNGLGPISSISETTRIKRDLSIHAYSGGRLHITGVSTSEGVNLIREAKKNQIGLTADVCILNLIGNDNDLIEFNTSLKALPPLRTKSDQKSLWKGLMDGTIDIIASDHNPSDIESKRCEFGKAKFGTATIENSFGWYRAKKANQKALDRWIEAVAHNPRKLFNLKDCIIDIGNDVDLTIFANDGSLTESKSLGVNVPNWNQNGRAIGTINNKKIIQL
tara:strand:+ start:14399 stop:15652 length:1254 start_codon:yes stop_codon:yes gene_type:complete